MRYHLGLAALAASASLSFTPAFATDLEVTHWWTSGGEAAAVAELAKAFDATGNHWVDGAIAGSGSTARPIMISRITGGDPMGATQFNHGRQAEELVQEGLMRDLSDVAAKEKWTEIVRPKSLLDSCTIDGKIYCAPVNIHSWQWLWLSNKAFADAGVAVPKNWDELVAAAPKLREKGIVPLAVGGQAWQAAGAFDVMVLSLGGKDLYMKVYGDKDAEAAAGPEMAKVFKAADAREMSQGTNVQDWNQATNMVITGKAGGQIMGDWAQGEFAVAGQVAGKDYSCLPGLGVGTSLATAGDAFYFPLLKDEEKSKAQEVLASTMLSPAVQVAFNAKKGSLPVRGDVDLSSVNDCTKKGLDILAKPDNVVKSTDELMSADSQKQKEDLFSQFFASTSMSVEEAQKRYAEIISSAD